MRRLYIIIALATALVAACTPGSDFADFDDGRNQNDNNGSDSNVTPAASIFDLTSMDISIDESALAEEENIPTDETAEDYEDYIENNEFANEVTIAFNGTSASYTGNVTGVTITINGADVIINSEAKKVKYTVTGTTNDGFLKIYSEKKFALALDGVDITNPDGAAINIQSSKRGYIILNDGTTNTLTDGTSYSDATDDEDMKATLFSEGKLLFSGSGSLKVYANCKAGIRSDDYVFFRLGNNIYVKATAGNAIKGNDAIYIKGGVIKVITTGAQYTYQRLDTSAKGIKSDGAMYLNGGTIMVRCTGGGGPGWH